MAHSVEGLASSRVFGFFFRGFGSLLVLCALRKLGDPVLGVLLL